jgi:uncharacterized damage-inducible protein DinB
LAYLVISSHLHRRRHRHLCDLRHLWIRRFAKPVLKNAQKNLLLSTEIFLRNAAISKFFLETFFRNFLTKFFFEIFFRNLKILFSHLHRRHCHLCDLRHLWIRRFAKPVLASYP